MSTLSSALIVGGGTIGGAIALELVERGYEVTVLDKGPFGGESSSAAAGLLGVQAEIFDKNYPASVLQESLRLHRPWTEKLESISGESVHYRPTGILRVATSKEDADAMQHRHREVPDSSQWLTADEVTKREPHIGVEVFGGILFPRDALFVPPAAMRALYISLTRLGCTVKERTPVYGLIREGHRVVGVRTSEGNFFADITIVSGGAWSTNLVSELGYTLPVHPIQGQAYLARVTPQNISHALQGEGIYALPRWDGNILIGASYVIGSYDKTPKISVLSELHDNATRLLPHLRNAELISTWVGLRPGTPDGRPYIGRLQGIDGLIVATGHQACGMMLSPLTGKSVAAMIHGEAMHPGMEEFDPMRVINADAQSAAGTSAE